jgi:hypothetical protein
MFRVIYISGAESLFGEANLTRVRNRHKALLNINTLNIMFRRRQRGKQSKAQVYRD